MERIDKIIAKELNIGRSDAKSLIKSGKVFLNGEKVKSSNQKFDEEKDILNVDGKEVKSRKFVYIMMNKPKGVISSTDGRKTGEKTVVDILPEEMKRKKLFPAGRLDKDTTGFMLITDDGEFAHKILNPKHHIPKTYIATLDKPFDEKVINAFEMGITIGEDICLPAKLEPVGNDFCKGMVTINQGMYHQIKRMFKRCGIEVVELERIKMGKLELDKDLLSGECKYLNENEINLINSR